MLRDIRSVFVALTTEPGDPERSSAVAYGLSLAQAAGAHLTVQAAAMNLRLAGSGLTRLGGAMVEGANARLLDLARAAVARVESDAAAAGVIADAHAPQLGHPQLVARFSALARVHDLTVIDAEPEAVHPDRDLFRALLMGSGRPLLVVPPGREAFGAGRVVVAWDGSARAARAAHDALPFLRAAGAVRLVTVTGEKALPDAVEGADLAPHLARHGVAVETESRPAPNGDAAAALRDAAAETGAELIVMGGYVHSPLRELLFGGVTQSLLRDGPVPLLLSH